MLETATALLRVWNSKRPLLRLPNEIIGLIMEHIPDFREDTEEDLRPIWHSAARDILMLFPISQTCHKLRTVALGNPSLWRHIHSTYNLELGILELLSRSGDLPLTVVTNGMGVLSVNLLKFTRVRAQELHVVHLDEDIRFLPAVFDLPWLHLSTLSIIHSEDTRWNGDLPISLSLVPRLRYLHLHNVSTFVDGNVPSLTHLSLSKIHLAKCHTDVATFLLSCPNLVNATFDGLTNPATPRVPPIANLPRLKRVTFHNMTTPIIHFYLTVFSCPRPGLALQVLSSGLIPLRRFPVESLLSRYSQGGPSVLEIAGHPVRDIEDPEDESDDEFEHKILVSVTACSETNAFRFCRTYDIIEQHLHRIVADKRSLSKLREVWITDIFASYSQRLTATISSVLASLPVLEMVIVVYDHSKFPQARPDLRILPKLSDLSSQSTRLRTLRLVHGFRKSSGTPQSSAKLSLKSVLLQLLSREYDYLDTLIVQTTPQFHVDDGELYEVMEHIPTVRHEMIVILPFLDLPDYCFEPASGSKAAFPESLW